MAKIYERLLSTIKLRENRGDFFNPQRENLLGEDSICMVNLLEIPQNAFQTILWFSKIGLDNFSMPVLTA